jgi:hypothetical protein
MATNSEAARRSPLARQVGRNKSAQFRHGSDGSLKKRTVATAKDAKVAKEERS